MLKTGVCTKPNGKKDIKCIKGWKGDRCMKKFIQRGMTICVLFTLVLMLLPHEMFAIQLSADTSSIASFEMKWTSAAVDGCIEYDANDVSKVTLTPAENKAKAAGTSITAQVKTEFTQANIRPGEIEIILPKAIFIDRSGQQTGNFSIGLPDNGDQNSFYYKISDDGNSLIVTNSQEITQAHTLIFDITYYTYNEAVNQKPSAISSGSIGKVQAELYRNGTLLHKADELQVTQITKSDLISLTKKKYKKYETWQKEWGAKPADAEDYFFVNWLIKGQFDASMTRPYQLLLKDVVDNNGTILGWYDPYFSKIEPGDTFGNNVFHIGEEDFMIQGDEAQLETPYFITHVLVKYPRKDAIKNSLYKNKVFAKVIDLYPNEMPTLDQEKSADASYSYVDFNFKYPEGNSWINKGFHNYICWGGNAPGFFNLMEQAHINDELPELQGHWANEMTTDGGIYTKGDGLPDNVLDSYGKKSYKTELVDDFVTLEDERLQENDYVFSAVHVVINEFDMTANEDIGGYLFNENTEYGNWEPADLYGRKSFDGEWIKLGKFICVGNKIFNFIDNDGKVFENIDRNNTVKLPAGIIALKLEHESKYFKNKLNLDIRIQLRKTAHVASLIEGKDSIMLYNINSGRIFDSNGKWVNQKNTLTIEGSEKIKEQMIERDKAEYCMEGALGNHSKAWVLLEGYPTTSNMQKEIVKTTNDTKNQQYDIEYQSYAYEAAYSNYADPFDEASDNGTLKEQKSGTFYDLLPKGMYVDVGKIKVTTVYRQGGTTFLPDKPCDFTVQIKENWKNSGRTMMIIQVSMKPGEKNSIKYTNIQPNGWEWESGFLLQYHGYYPWESCFDFGRNISNSIAYKSGNESITNGYPDMPDASFSDQKWFIDIDEDGKAGESAQKDTLYASVSTSLTGDTFSKLGFFKSVKNQQELKYAASTEVLTGDSYSYRLQYSSQDTAKANNLVLFDVLENNAGEREHWKGTLQSVDVSSALRKGVDAKVLYSMKKDIILSHDDAGLKGDANIEDETIWSAEKPADMSKVTAVAIDMRNTVEGTPFVLESQQQVSAILHMKAPIDIIKQDMEKKILAYNTSWVNANTQVSNVEWQDSLLETTETTVAIREPEMEIHKTSTPASGTQDHPAKVKKHDEINYDISVKNGETSFLLNAIKVEDILPSGLDIQLDAIAWYLGNDSTKQQLVKDSQFVEVMQDAKNKQKLIFTIEALQAEQELHFVIPTKVTDNGDDTLFVNTAKIIEVHQHSFEKESETTYHELDITTADFLFYKIDEEGNKLANAKFAAYELNCKSDAHDHAKDIVKLDQDGNVVSNDPCWKKRSIAISQESDGSVKLTGLNIEKQYRLVEYMAPIGYVLPAGQWMLAYDTQQKAFQITGSLDNPPAFERKEDESFELMNYRLKEIPITGSIGYDEHLYLLGLGCIFYGSLLFWRKKKKLKERGGE